MPEPTCLAAYTAPDSSYPPYLNATRLSDGRVRVTVRGEGWCSKVPASYRSEAMCAEVILTAEAWNQFVADAARGVFT